MSLTRRTKIALFAALGAGATLAACAAPRLAEQLRAPGAGLSPRDAALQLDTDFVRPLPGLDHARLERFEHGRRLFEKNFSPSEGLGPLFNATSCKACHGLPAAGGGSLRTVTLVAGDVRGANVPLKEKGGPMIQADAIEGVPQERLPAEACALSVRLSSPTFGMGLIEAVPAEAITAQLAPDPRKEALGIHGLANWEFDQIGRFGWKAQKGDMIEFSQQACQFELGLSTSGRPQEHFPNLPPQALASPSAYGAPEAPWVKAFFDRKRASGKPPAAPDLDKAELEALAAFQRYQAPPAPLPRDARAEAGARLFEAQGCALCHAPGFTTGPNDAGVPEGLPVPLYSDLLVHDMGPASSDGLVMGLAKGSYWRTPPLWGLRFREKLMHDGRAESFGEAIAQHGGEGAGVAAGYAALSVEEKAAIAAFLKTL